MEECKLGYLFFGGPERKNIINCGNWCSVNVTCSDMFYVRISGKPAWHCHIEGATVAIGLAINCKECAPGFLDINSCTLDMGLNPYIYRYGVIVSMISILAIVFSITVAFQLYMKKKNRQYKRIAME